MRKLLIIVVSAALLVACAFWLGFNQPGEALTSVIVQGKDLASVRAAVESVGGEITHELGIIRSVGARVTSSQREQLGVSAAVQHVYSDLPEIRVAGSQGQGVGQIIDTLYPTLIGADLLHEGRIVVTIGEAGVRLAVTGGQRPAQRGRLGAEDEGVLLAHEVQRAERLAEETAHAEVAEHVADPRRHHLLEPLGVHALEALHDIEDADRPPLDLALLEDRTAGGGGRVLQEAVEHRPDRVGTVAVIGDEEHPGLGQADLLVHRGEEGVAELTARARRARPVPVGALLHVHHPQGEALEHRVPGSLDAGTRDGIVYTLPMQYNSYSLFINNRLFEEAGLDPVAGRAARSGTSASRPISIFLIWSCLT